MGVSQFRILPWFEEQRTGSQLEATDATEEGRRKKAEEGKDACPRNGAEADDEVLACRLAQYWHWLPICQRSATAAAAGTGHTEKERGDQAKEGKGEGKDYQPSSRNFPPVGRVLSLCSQKWSKIVLSAVQ